MVARYQDSLASHRMGDRPLYRSREEREAAWARVGGKENKATCFRKTGASTVLTVPSTEGGKLAMVVKEAIRSAVQQVSRSAGVNIIHLCCISGVFVFTIL